MTDHNATRSEGANVFFIITSGDVRHALTDICNSLRQLGCGGDQIMQTEIVLAEILNNIVEHAYSGTEPNQISVLVDAAASTLQVEIRDFGIAMPGGKLPDGHLPSAIPDDVANWPEGGFGWAMIRELADDLSYQRVGDENVVQFRIGVNS